jgi:tetratricopeptide (TPR) repeat protein
VWSFDHDVTDQLKNHNLELIVDAFNHNRWEDLFRYSCAAAAADPSWCFAWKASGTASRKLSSSLAAITAYNRAVTIDPTDYSAWTGRGAALAEGGDVGASLDSFLKGLSIGVDIPAVYFDFALSLEANGRLAEARERCRQAYRLDSVNHLVWLCLGRVATALNKFDQAVRFYESSLAINPASAQGLSGLGSALLRQHQLDRSFFFHAKAIALVSAEMPETLIELGFCFVEQKKLDYALETFFKSLCLCPESSRARNGLALAYRDGKSFGDSILQASRSILISDTDPTAWDIKGTALKESGAFDLGRNCYEAAIVINPGLSETWSNRGTLLRDLRSVKEALVDYERAIFANPSNVAARWNQSLVLLSLGEFSDGWLLHEYRFATGVFPSNAVQHLPKFSPGRHRDSRILVTAEQGVGDELMFCSMLVDFSKSHGPLVVQVDPRLRPLFRRSMPKQISIADDDGGACVDSCAAQISMGSLPLYVGAASADCRKGDDGYLRPDLNSVDVYRRAIRGRANDLVIGISWRSTNAESALRRNIPLEALCDALRTKYPRAKIVSLQYGDVDEEVAAANVGGRELISYPGVDLTHDLDQVAALICACDVVVTIGNTVAHLAGALGKRAAVLLPYNPSWRWMLTGDRTPWYGCLRLYRKKNAEAGWLEVIRDAIAGL